MSVTSDVIIKRIKFIRKSKQRSMHDCAKILGLSRETYHGFETGSTPLTLPELELLAIYLGVDLSDLLDDDHHHPLYTTFLKEDLRPRYVELREKMIRARIAQEVAHKDLTLDEMAATTQIPQENLQAYRNGETPIPLQDLIAISNYLQLPLLSFSEPIWPGNDGQGSTGAQGQWQPEFAPAPAEAEPIEEPFNEDPFSDLMTALKRLPPQDQADIAKIIHEKLRSI
jgi:transcriptional regulator with XRE-family HTH domain